MVIDEAPAGSSSTFDCRECAACCRGRPGTVLISAHDLLRWRQQGRSDLLASLVPGHFGQDGLAARPDGACVHLGTPGHPRDCSIYPTRPEVCAAFEAGSAACLAARRTGSR